MRTIRSILLAGVVTVLAAAPASAALITYDVTVDSSSISGTAGSLDFQFQSRPAGDAGGVAPDAQLRIRRNASSG
jgi:hypothetical protein